MQGSGTGGTAPAFPPGFGIAVIAGLADDVQISETAGGTSIRMSWPSAVTAS
jgi:serine/threonine-protein kinase RsbW